jgi:hypothetical protein
MGNEFSHKWEGKPIPIPGITVDTNHFLGSVGYDMGVTKPDSSMKPSQVIQTLVNDAAVGFTHVPNTVRHREDLEEVLNARFRAWAGTKAVPRLCVRGDKEKITVVAENPVTHEVLSMEQVDRYMSDPGVQPRPQPSLVSLHRRRCLIRLSWEILSNFLAWDAEGKVKLLKLPIGTTVLQAFNDDQRRCLTLVLYHPDFEEVPAGMEPPYIEPEVVIIDVPWALRSNVV